MKVARLYLRVSTDEQDLTRQLDIGFIPTKVRNPPQEFFSNWIDDVFFIFAPPETDTVFESKFQEWIFEHFNFKDRYRELVPKTKVFGIPLLKISQRCFYWIFCIPKPNSENLPGFQAILIFLEQISLFKLNDLLCGGLCTFVGMNPALRGISSSVTAHRAPTTVSRCLTPSAACGDD